MIPNCREVLQAESTHTSVHLVGEQSSSAAGILDGRLLRNCVSYLRSFGFFHVFSTLWQETFIGGLP